MHVRLITTTLIFVVGVLGVCASAHAQPGAWNRAQGAAGIPQQVLDNLQLTPQDFDTKVANASGWQLVTPGQIYERLDQARGQGIATIDLPTPSGLQSFTIQADGACGDSQRLTWRTVLPVGRGPLTALLRRSFEGVRIWGTDANGAFFQVFVYDKVHLAIKSELPNRPDGITCLTNPVLSTPKPIGAAPAGSYTTAPKAIETRDPNASTLLGPRHELRVSKKQTVRVLVLNTDAFVDLANKSLKEARDESAYLVRAASQIFGRDASVELCSVEITDTKAVLTADEVDQISKVTAADWPTLVSKIVLDHASTLMYDLGHVLTTGAQSVGQAIPSGLGTPLKGAAESRLAATRDFLVFGHELGHQLGAGHSFNGTEFETSWNGASAVEPGSGSTLMSYASVWQSSGQIMKETQPYLHVGSIAEIRERVERVFALSAMKPQVTITFPIGAAFSVPPRTPLMLTASASSVAGTARLRWDEIDLGDRGATPPRFRSYEATDTIREFPSANHRWSYGLEIGNDLPNPGETLTFRAAAWNDLGDIASRDLVVTTCGYPRNDCLPFEVTKPPFGWKVNQPTSIEWTVRYDGGVTRVRAWLSLNGGRTWSVVGEGAMSDGRMAFTPSTFSANARLRVEAIGNVFFNDSGAFEILQ